MTIKTRLLLALILTMSGLVALTTSVFAQVTQAVAGYDEAYFTKHPVAYKVRVVANFDAGVSEKQLDVRCPYGSESALIPLPNETTENKLLQFICADGRELQSRFGMKDPQPVQRQQIREAYQPFQFTALTILEQKELADKGYVVTIVKLL
jgi:hypothetical protein